MHKDAEVQPALPKPIIRQWEKVVTIRKELVLDMKRMFPFIFWVIPSPYNFVVLVFFKMIHLHLLLFHNHNRLSYANIVIKLAM